VVLRERVVSDPRAAEILLRWLQRPRAEERVGGVDDLDSMSERKVERLYAGLLKLAALPDEWSVELEPSKRTSGRIMHLAFQATCRGSKSYASRAPGGAVRQVPNGHSRKRSNTSTDERPRTRSGRVGR
jgi:hypothetical protein